MYALPRPSGVALERGEIVLWLMRGRTGLLLTDRERLSPLLQQPRCSGASGLAHALDVVRPVQWFLLQPHRRWPSHSSMGPTATAHEQL